MRLEISVLSKPGGRALNEDAFGFWANAGVCFCVVCDGAGGQGGGDVASKLAVTAALAWFQATPECSGNAIEAALGSANQAVMKHQGAGRSSRTCARRRWFWRSMRRNAARHGASRRLEALLLPQAASRRSNQRP
jgi:serine/threonine protein phosphatase PrpC